MKKQTIFKSLVELRKLKRRHPGLDIWLNINPRTDEVTYTCKEKDLLWEGLLQKANRVMNKAKVEQFKRFFEKR